MVSPQIQHDLELLQHRAQSIAAVNNSASSENRFKRALDALQRLAENEAMGIAIVGGLAAIRHGYPAVTEDIDILVATDQMSQFLDKAPTYGFKIAWRAESGWHTLEYNDVEINVVPEGGSARNDAPTKIPGPQQCGVALGVDYAELKRWIELKVSSYRRKDQTHIVEVLKANAPHVAQEVRQHLKSIHPDYVTRFDELANEAEQERQQERERQ